MITPDDLSIMTEEEKLEFLRRVSEAEDWQDSFEPIYARLMDDESPRVREEAIAALWDVADVRHIEPLMDKAENDPATEVRGRAVSVLGIYIYEAVDGAGLDHGRYLAVRHFLLETARDPDEEPAVRRMAVEALSFDADEEVHDLIEWAYQHPALDMRMSAIFAMGRSGSARWYDTILDELDSDETRLKIEAVNAAGEARLAEATPALRALTRHPDRKIQLPAIWALSHTGGPGALETLEMCSQSEDEEVRRTALSAIEELRNVVLMEPDDAPDDFETD